MTAPAAAPDTIFARASGAGRAGVCVFRISGPAARAVAERLSTRRLETRRPTLAAIRDPETGEMIDRGLVILFAAPASFTGEDVAEFHLHGSRAVEAAFVEAAARAGARPAGPGDFTRRALANGKLDLAQVEALADLIDAETTQQRKQALGQLEGRLSALAENWRARLVAILAPLEADIDFPDEEGVPAAVAARAGPAIDALISELRSYREGAGRARRLREGVTAAIIGAPNAGKSSLLNALAGADVAIVSATAGTTRDVIETRLDLGGIPVLFADTAGLRDQTTDDIEAEGVRRALGRAQAADLRILVIDPGAMESARNVSRETLLRPGDIIVWSKRDLGAAPGMTPQHIDSFHVSATTGEGVAALMAGLAVRAAELAGGAEGAALTRIRHVQAVEEALTALERARRRVESDPELAAEDARLAARALGRITGAVGVEDVLDEIFSSFCIGK